MSGAVGELHEPSPAWMRLTPMRVTFAITFLAASLAASWANAQTIGSQYSSTAPKDCRRIGKPSEFDGSTTRLCPGKAGLSVLISEDDLRETVSVGRSRAAAAKEPAAQARFEPFNSSQTTVEWRVGRGKTCAVTQ